MIDRQGGKILIECDTCDEVFEGEDGEFATVWSTARRAGWKSGKTPAGWMHACSDCTRRATWK